MRARKRRGSVEGGEFELKWPVRRMWMMDPADTL